MSKRLLAASLFVLSGVLLIVETGKLLFGLPLIVIGVVVGIWWVLKWAFLAGMLVLTAYVAVEYNVIEMARYLLG